MKKINGTFLEIHHLGLPEGKYFNDQTHAFTEEQWRAKVRELYHLHMKYVIILASADYGCKEDINECYYDSKYFPKSTRLGCDDPMGVVLDECDKLKMKVFLAPGFYSDWHTPWVTMQNEESFEKAFKVMEEIHEIYGHHESFYGWYYPDELGIDKYFDEFFITYVNRYSAKIHSLNSNYKTLIAPYGTNHVVVDDTYIDQLRRLDIDFIAYQDEVGVKKSNEYETKEYYKQLKKAHDLANRSKLWADMEVFTFEGDVYKSALLPADIHRIKTQIESISEYVEEIVIFSYQCAMNEPGTIAYCGADGTTKLFEDYQQLLQEIEQQ